jgi:cytochrome c peroxidase
MWDGRAGSLEEQAVGPMQAPAEMNQTMPRLIALLQSIPGYREAFEAAFPGEPISAKTIAKAIATFERTVTSGEAPFDRWIAGDETAVSEPARRGFVLFNTSGHCAACHSGWRFTDDSFHDIGLADDDLGRGTIIEGVEPLQHAFKTPGLRNVAARAPFMHNGSIPTLAGVVRHYKDGFVARPSLSSEIHRLDSSDQDIDDLVAFMKTLTSKDPRIEVPVLPTMELVQ